MKYAGPNIFGCWIWTGRTNQGGYPVIWQGRKPVSAYKVSYELVRGPVPADRVLDHVCRNRMCVAPHHLEAVTKEENERRKSWPYRARIEKCQSGHALSTTGVMTEQGGRVCRECNRFAVGIKRANQGG